jgi:hypothetical protein
MKTRNGIRFGVTAIALLTLSLASVVSHAQQDGGQGGPPPGGPGGFGGGQGPGGGRGFGGPGGPGGGRIQPATAPVEVLASELKLTTTQADKIKAIQTAYNKDRSALMPNRGGGPGGQGGDQGGPPDREAMQAMFQKMQTLDKTASDKIAAVLTDDQKTAMPGVLQMLGALQGAGIPPQALASLKLTSAQKTKAVSISKEMQTAMDQARQDQDREAMQEARSKGQTKIQSLLTSDQKAALDKFVKDHPNPQGGRGGFGGPGGGPGGPGGGQGGDGPPPPPDGNGPPPAN